MNGHSQLADALGYDLGRDPESLLDCLPQPYVHKPRNGDPLHSILYRFESGATLPELLDHEHLQGLTLIMMGILKDTDVPVSRQGAILTADLARSLMRKEAYEPVDYETIRQGFSAATTVNLLEHQNILRRMLDSEEEIKVNDTLLPFSAAEQYLAQMHKDTQDTLTTFQPLHIQSYTALLGSILHNDAA